jgi:16S rRNA (guanine527-N7)-methyltransferase
MVIYLRELTHWNEKVNLTSLTTDTDIVTKHFLDSLAAFKLIKPDTALIRPGPSLRILDVGTGAGFPGLVLKLQAPDKAVTLLEPSLKKAAFLHHIIGLLGLSGVTVITRRLEQLTDPEQAGAYDLVTTRAVAPEVVLAASPRLLVPGGRVLLFRVSPLAEDPPGFKLIRQVSFPLPFTNDPRTLSLLAPASAPS